ncbi:MAG: phosphoribosylglycinamide formyltransferase [Clostridiales bacterium]|jgi:phosphoribosylglycinamide formyltransferase-1|nr:phosphoribosylglycinamide formyltransferase [Clostridiales bacterium]
MLKVGALVSGGGTNLQAVINACEAGEIPARVVCVISNKREAYALTRAEKHGIPSFFLPKENFEAEAEALLARREVGLVVLAGFLRVLSEDFTKKFRVINVHPSLIPSFCGKGFYGLKVHEAALARGVKVTGATVHYVDGGCDSGPIILQKAVEVRDGDTPETLQARVMERAERIILPEAIGLIAKETNADQKNNRKNNLG